MTLGPWILLPESAHEWTSDRLRAVLLHERAHVTRHDSLIALLGDLASAVYWFHPLAWLVAHRARLERERACDDAVLAAGMVADEYASAIVDVARSTRRVAMAMPMAARSQLEERITAILDPHVARRTSRGAIGITVAIVLAIAPALAALEAIPRPRSGEPDLLNDAVARPQSEIVTTSGDDVTNVRASGPDAALIALLLDAASQSPRAEDDYVPRRARWALTRVRDGQLVEPLLESLQDRDWRIRAYAAWALGYSGDARATAPLIEQLDDPVWRMRAMAAHSLANLGDPAAEEAMLRVVDDPAWQVRSQVARYLGVLKRHPATLRALRGDRHIAVRTFAEEALGR